MNKVTVLRLREEKREHCGLCLEGGQKQHKHLQHIAALLHSFHLNRYGSLSAHHSHNNEWRKQSEQIFVSCIRLTFYSEKKTRRFSVLIFDLQEYVVFLLQPRVERACSCARMCTSACCATSERIPFLQLCMLSWLLTLFLPVRLVVVSLSQSNMSL